MNTNPIPEPEPEPRRWAILALICGLQFMLVLDITVVNVALPHIQASLGFTMAGLAWVVNGYVLMSGGLLLLGGRLADAWGRRRLLLIGVAIFAVASALSGAAPTAALLVAGRLGQGLAEALAAPASLGLIALLFTDGKERAKALGLWGGLAALGGTLGYVLSGLLTDLVSWRWIFYVNVPIAVVVLAILPRWLKESRSPRAKTRLDAAGAAFGTLGLFALVWGLLQAADHAWGSVSVAAPLLVGGALLILTVVIEAKSSHPLFPLTFFRNRTRGAVNVTTLLFMSSFFAYTFLTTLLEQQVYGYSPLMCGLSWLPLGIGVGVGIGIGSGLMAKVGVRAVAVAGFLGSGVGLGLTSLTASASYWTLLPGMLVFGVFAGMSMPSCTSAALHGVTAQNSGLAAGVQTTLQQIGAALGLALLVPLAYRQTAQALAAGESVPDATMAGFSLALRLAALLLFVGGLALLFAMENVKPEVRNPLAESMSESA